MFSCAGANVTSPRRGAEPTTAEEDRGLRTINSGGEDIAVASLNTPSAQTQHPLSNSQHQPQGQQTTVGTTDRWTSLRDAGRASTDINPRCQQDMAGVTSHRTTPEDISRALHGGVPRALGVSERTPRAQIGADRCNIHGNWWC